MRAGRLTLFFLSLVALSSLAPALAWAQTSETQADESAFTERVAQERASRGVGTLVVAPDLVEVARRHSERMAARGSLYHNPSLGSEVQNWEVVGENVGVGANVEEIHTAFMGSDAHRDEILYAAYQEIGVGVVHANGQVWVTEVFRKPTAPATSAAVAPAAAPAAPPPTAPPSTQAPATTVPPPPPPTTPSPPPAAPVTTTTVAPAPPVTEAPTTVPAAAAPTTRVAAVALSAPTGPLADAVDEIPTPALVAAGLLCLVVGAQCVVVRRLRLA